MNYKLDVEREQDTSNLKANIKHLPPYIVKVPSHSVLVRTKHLFQQPCIIQCRRYGNEGRKRKLATQRRKRSNYLRWGRAKGGQWSEVRRQKLEEWRLNYAEEYSRSCMHPVRGLEQTS